MASKTLGYVLGAIQIIAGILLIATPFGVPLIVSGTATIAGTALTPTPPRQKQLRDSPTYGIDRFENPRGPEAHIPILYGEHTVKPVVINESVTEAIEGVSPGDIRNTRRQEFRWLGIVAEGEIEDITDIRINGREILSKLYEEELGRGNGNRRTFTFPHRKVVLGDDEMPGVELFVDGVKKAWMTRTASAAFTVPVPPPVTYNPLTGLPLPRPKLTFNLRRDDRTDRILGRSLRLFIRGPGAPEFEQLRGVSVYRWSAQKLAGHRVKIRFKRRPPRGFTVRVAYEYLGAEGVAFTQNVKGVTKVIFGRAPASGKKVTATYRTAAFRRLRIVWRPGTLDQQPIDGFTDLEQSRNPSDSLLKRYNAISYSTAGREADNLRIGITAPQGMIHYKDDGGTRAVQVALRVEYRKLGASSWKRLRSAGGNSFVLIGERPGTMRWEIDVKDELTQRAIEGESGATTELEEFDRDAYEVRVTRLTAHPTDPLVVDELNFTYVTEVLHEGFCYPGTALLGLRGSPGAFLSGGSLRVTCIARRAKLHDPRTDAQGGARDLGSSQNAALAIRDLVTSAEGAATERYGAGFFFTGQDLFLGADGSPAERNGLIAFADFCDAWVHRPGDDATRPASATNGERRCRLNVVFDTPQSLMETVGDIAFLGYCFATLQGARWRFPLDQDGDSVFTFVDDVDPSNQNMSKFVLKLDEWGKSPSGIQGSFWNETIRHERDELLYPVDGLPDGTPTNIREVNLRGATRETEAARMLRHLAVQARELPFPCSWEAHPGVQHIEAADIVTVKTRVPYSTGPKAMELKVRVLAGIVGRDEDGKIVVRYAGRVMKSSAYALQPVTVPVSAQAVAVPAHGRRTTRRGRRPRRVTNLRARVR